MDMIVDEQFKHSLGAEIIVVDDEELVREVHNAQLAEAGFSNIRTFSSAADAIERLMVSAPDVILTDLMMPELSGQFLIRLVRCYPRFDRIPIVAVTSQKTDETFIETINNGANAVVHKPVDKELLVKTVQMMIANRAESKRNNDC